MKSYSLGFLVPEACAADLYKSTMQIEEIFESQGIPVSWTSKDRYNISIIYFGKDLNFFQLFFLKRLLASYEFDPFDVSLGKSKIGMSNRYKELIYLPIENGAENLRNLLLSATKHFRYKREHSFIPHLTIGRVSKDLSEQEYRNLHHEIDRSMIGNSDCNFTVNKLSLLEMDSDSFNVVAS